MERFLDEPGRFGHVVRNHLEQHYAARQHCTQPLRTRAADRTIVSTVVKLPNAEFAKVPPEKLRDYLISPTHSIGRYKAAFFRSLGYDQDGYEALAADLRTLLEDDAETMNITEYGIKYSISGSITGPNGRSANVVSVWIILTGEDVPRFVTAYPEE